MPELEQRLSNLGVELDWPATPNLVPAVRSRITTPVVLRGPWYQSRWALAAVAVVIALAALVAYQPSRDAIASWVNVHVFFQRVQTVPTPSPLPPGTLGQRLGLGSQTMLSDAQKQVSWHVMAPSSLGQPDEVYLQLPPTAPAKGEVTLVYATRPGIPVAGETGVSMLVTEAQGAVDRNFFGKMLGPGTTLEEVTVAGHHGYWVAGSLHDFYFIDANGSFRSETMRLATNTLVLDLGGTVVRIEGNLTKTQALDIAASLR
ncbi:MAG TPA: hypothetical protein VIO37_11860 [Candidatus Dormibacteraeota bacterium]